MISSSETSCQCDTTSCSPGHTCSEGVCKCGNSEECTGTSNICQTKKSNDDTIKSACVCGDTEDGCPVATPSCLTTTGTFLALDLNRTCKACSNEVGKVVAGDATTQGTCPLVSDVCLPDGKCMCQLDLLGGGEGNGMAMGTCTTDSDRCLDNGECKCQKKFGKKGDGDGSTQGTCTDDSHKCLDDGSCRVCRMPDSSGCNSNSNICTNGECKCGLTDAACDSSSTSRSPLCLTNVNKVNKFVQGDVTATCQGCKEEEKEDPAPGDGKTKGTCTTSTHKCYSDGSCKECEDDSECTGNANACDVSTGTCKCASNKKCDESGTTPSCLNPKTNKFIKGDDTSVCAACNNDKGEAGDANGMEQGTCPKDICLTTGACGKGAR